MFMCQVPAATTANSPIVNATTMAKPDGPVTDRRALRSQCVRHTASAKDTYTLFTCNLLILYLELQMP